MTSQKRFVARGNIIIKFYSRYFREIVDYSTKDLVDKESNVGGKSDILRYEVRVVSTK